LRYQSHSARIFAREKFNSSDTQSFLTRIFFLTTIVEVEDALRPESPDHDGRVRCRPLR
jgi:hypothetical protein